MRSPSITTSAFAIADASGIREVIVNVHHFADMVADYLKKPFAIDEVMSVVEREIARSKGRRKLIKK